MNLRSLLLALVVALLAGACASSNHARFQGDWRIDVDTMIERNAQMKAAVTARPELRAQLQERQSHFAFEVREDTIISQDPDGRKVSRYTVVSDEGTKLVIANTPEGKTDAETLTIEFATENSMGVETEANPGQQIWMRRR